MVLKEACQRFDFQRGLLVLKRVYFESFGREAIAAGQYQRVFQKKTSLELIETRNYRRLEKRSYSPRGKLFNLNQV